MTDKPALPSLTESLKAEDFTFQLDIGHVAVYFMNIIKAAAYQYEHREEADYHALMLSLRAMLFGDRKEVF